MWLTARHAYGPTGIRRSLLQLKHSTEGDRATSLIHILSTARTTMVYNSMNSSNPTRISSVINGISSMAYPGDNSGRLASTYTSLPDKIKTFDQYRELYDLSITDPNQFWKMAANRLDWYRFPTIIKNTEFDFNSQRGVEIKWFEDGILNVCYNCVDRHIERDPSMAQQVAFIFETDAVTTTRKHLTYGELLRDVKKFANVLKKHGVRKGDRVTIYMPMVLETCIALLACARIGAVHSVVFGGFSSNNVAERIADCDSTVIITTDVGVRGGKCAQLKGKVDQALKFKQCGNVNSVLVFQRNQGMTEVKDDCAQTAASIEWTDGRDFWVHKEMQNVDDECLPEQMNAEDPLFILYTSGSTGKPKGILHTTGGYLTYANLTFKYVFDYNPGEVYMCTADIGWITGHSYALYGPLSNRATSIVFEGIPTYPEVSRFWDIVDKHQVNIFYTAPTAIRSLMAHDDSFVTRTNRYSLRILGTVGEPINPEAWHWYNKIVGNKRCPIVDTWWQTETGGFMITPIPNVIKLEPGSATLPFFGVQTQLFDKKSRKPLQPPCTGELCIRDSWPGQARTIYGDHKRFVDTYFKTYPGSYFTGDGCEIKQNGYHWITGRVDDVLIISGHNIGTAEVEAALDQHPSVSESAVVGYPDPKKNQGMYCFVTLKDDVKESEELKKELIMRVREIIGAHVYPDFIHFAPNLPKTRSGKIMRRILRKIVEPDISNLGDTSTLNDPAVVEDLISKCPRTKRV